MQKHVRDGQKVGGQRLSMCLQQSRSCNRRSAVGGGGSASAVVVEVVRRLCSRIAMEAALSAAGGENVERLRVNLQRLICYILL
nr:hypothetical protein Iba_chr04bCG15720 [Ipomoea batatas]